MLSEYSVTPFMLEEYIKNDAERVNGTNSNFQCVYDCIEQSPFYNNDDQYIDEWDAIELPSPKS